MKKLNLEFLIEFVIKKILKITFIQVVLIFAAFDNNLSAQAINDLQRDTTIKEEKWDLEKLPDLKLDSNLTKPVLNLGWFPQPFDRYFSIGINFTPTSLLCYADNIMTKDMYNFGGKFQASIFNPPSNDEREIANTKDPKEKNEVFPTDDFIEIGISSRFNYGLPIFINFDLTYFSQTSYLFSVKYDNYYLNENKEIIPFQERHYVYIDDWGLKYSAGITIPIYGAYMQFLDTKLESAYFLSLDFGNIKSFESLATQYVQITKEKEHIRYANLQDTSNYYNAQAWSNINKDRAFFNVGIGTRYSFSKIAFDFSIQYTRNLVDVLKDAAWHTDLLGYRLSVSYCGF